MFNLEELIKYHVDMHVHCNADASPNHVMTKKNEDVVTKCRESGMHGLVLKTHGWPAVRLANKLNEMYDDFTVYPSVSLNQTAGGPYPWVMEMAIQMGARVVWLPTWSSLNDKYCPGGFTQLVINENSNKYFKDIPDEAFYTVTDEDGNVKDNIKKIVQMAKEAGIVLATGHGSTAEALAVARYAHEIGFQKLVFTHPTCGVSPVTHEQLKEFADLGGYIEFCTLGVQPLYTSMTVAEWKEICELCGYDHCFLASDHFFDWTPSIPEQYATMMNCMYTVGSTMEELSAMAKVPLKLLEG